MIDEALRLVSQRYQRPEETPEAADDDRTARQLENLRRLGRKVQAMPTAPVADGLSNRDHDRILYGR